MSTKDLFNRNYLTDKNEKDAFSEIESADNAKAIHKKQNTFVPQINYADPLSFAKYGSARLYYESAIDRVIDFYPYDGSDAELNEFYNKSLDIEKYVFNNRYPRTNGYANFSPDGWGTTTQRNGGYGSPSTNEYITFKAGPNSVSQTAAIKSLVPDPTTSTYQYSNVYDENIYTNDGLPSDYGTGTRTSNLRSNFDDGVTIEFWAKTGSLSPLLTEKQVITDLWNNAASSSADYGRITVELDGTATGSPWLITVESGSTSVFQQVVGTGVTVHTLSDWKHYSFVLQNSGSDFHIKLYVDGELDDTEVVTSTTISELNPDNMMGRIGALQTAPKALADASEVTNYNGAGKLSGSIDEFRFWKIARNAKEVGQNWFTQIRGGVNTDISNTTLGMYYKFNEGITTNNTIDSVVLDYGGRICNGTWTGYGVNSRNTGSAIVSASAATAEYLDPIVYSTHPSVVSLRSELVDLGTYHDAQNNSMFLKNVPAWVLEEAEDLGRSDLEKLTHIMGAYFDKLYLQIQAIPSFRQANYTSASYEPLPFSQHLPQSLGLYTPEIFIDSNILEKFANRNDTQLFQEDLNKTKNLIYQNIYNNLANIFKTKGTEKSIRNVLRCFNIDDNLVYLRTYSNNQLFEIKNNLKQTQKKRRLLNLNKQTSTTAVVYQAADPSVTDSRGFISGSEDLAYEDNYGFTTEVGVKFPKFIRSLDQVDRSNIDTVSLFGMHSASVDDENDTTIFASDNANFQVQAIRDSIYSKNVYFKLSSSITPFPVSELTTSLFYNVYDDENWNLSVGLRPSKYPYTNVSSGSEDFTYDFFFRGYNNKLGSINNSFELTSSITKAVGQDFLRAAKRLYVGATNENITGSTNTFKSDVQFTDARYWTKFVDSFTLKQHSVDRENFGISGSYRNVNAINNVVSNQNSYNFNSLALNWYFQNVTSSDSGGQFYVTDLSSGSAFIRDNFGWTGQIAGYAHTGRGNGFAADDTEAAINVIVNEFKFTEPERVVASDMVQVLSEDDELKGTFEQVPNYVFVVEKSLYGAVSEEILDFFAGSLDFNNLIGDPVNRYRKEYKSLNYLRNIFFERFSDIATVEKYIDYYKWFDDSLAAIIAQLVPASAEFINDVYNTIENHVLERNKYQSQFPTIEFKQKDPEASIRGIVEAKLSYELDLFGGLESSPRPTDVHKNFWQKRALPGPAGTADFEITSSDAALDTKRRQLRAGLWSRPQFSSSMPTLRTIEGTNYTLNRLLETQKVGTIDFSGPENITINRTVAGGVNFEFNKDIHYTQTSLYPAGPVLQPSGGVFVPQNVLFGETVDLSPIDSVQDWELEGNISKKRKRHLGIVQGRDYTDGLGYEANKNSFAFPFNVMSASISGGIDDLIRARTEEDLSISNLHNDAYGSEMEIPMQGPFTNYAVGGHQSRHVKLNVGSDDYTNRPEAWKLLLGKCDLVTGAIGMTSADYPWPEANDLNERPYPMTASQKAVYYRDHIAKRPVNIRNIQMRTGSTILGNYENKYEVVHSFGAFDNPRNFVENQPSLPPIVFSQRATGSTQGRTYFDTRRLEEMHFELLPDYNTGYLSGAVNKTIINSRFDFGAGGLLTNGNGYRDFRSNELSVYNALNNRFVSVVRPSQPSSGSTSEVTGAGTPGIRVSDIHGRDFGLTSHAARHTARFGRDSTLVTDPGASYVQSPGFHKIHRNNIDCPTIETTLVFDPSEGWNEVITYSTQSTYDNFNIQHQIPRMTKQYAWITASLENDNGVCGFTSADFTRRVSSSTGIDYVDALDFVSASEDGSFFTSTRRFPGQATSAQFIPQTYRINTNIREPISASSNVLGYPDSIPLADSTESNTQYVNIPFIQTVAIAELSSAPAFNNLMFKRGNQYGYPSWKQVRQQDHPILIDEKLRNKISVVGTGSTLTEYDLRPVSMVGRPSYVNIDFLNTFSSSLTGVVEQRQNATFKTSYSNEYVLFNDKKFDEYVDINFDEQITPFEQLVAMKDRNNIQLNWILYQENVFPSLRNEFASASATRVDYNNGFWRTSQTDRTNNGVGLPNSFGLSGSYVTNAANSQFLFLTQSIWSLDAPLDFETRTGPAFVVSASAVQPHNAGANASLVVSNSAGELQNTYSSYTIVSGSGTVSNGTLAGALKNAALYSRKHMLNSPLSMNSPSNVQGGLSRFNTSSVASVDAIAAGMNNIATASGEAKWEAADNAGYLTTSNGITSFVSAASSPFYDNYDDFRAEIKTIAKGYSVVPEFRISDQVENYTKFGILGAENFDTFAIPGTQISSSQDSFYKDYSNSDFLENFLDVRQLSDLTAKEIKLTCRAAVKFHPYKGFYPAQRTLDLVSQFSKSYGNTLTVSDQNASITSDTVGANIFAGPYGKPVTEPLFAPGILFNSIKSGLATDYPIVTNANKIEIKHVTGSTTDADGNITENYAFGTKVNSNFQPSDEYITGSWFDKRMPFEAIIDPMKHMKDVNFPFIEPHPSESFNHAFELTASIGNGPVDNIYTLMASNFIAETGKFFLNNNSYTKLSSNGFNLSTFKFEEGEIYGARLRLRSSYTGSRDYTKESGSTGDNTFYAPNGARALNIRSGDPVGTAENYDATNISLSGAYEIPQDPAFNSSFKKNFVMYSRTTAFGPSILGRLYTGSLGGTALESNINASALSASNFGAKDSLNGYNWAYTPPYYDGEAWVDFIFTPSGSVDYDLERILKETKTVTRRFDPGEAFGKNTSDLRTQFGQSTLVRDRGFWAGASDIKAYMPYSGMNIDDNAMQIDSAINLFGVENVPKREFDKFGQLIVNKNEVAAQKWTIQPKFETPMMNFVDTGIHPISVANGTLTLPQNFGSESVPRGMWHQFGTIPSTANEGIFMDIGEIPTDWLRNHYQVIGTSSVYNKFDGPNGINIHQEYKSFADLMGFTSENSSVRLGEMAQKQTIKEAVVAVPYIVEGLTLEEQSPAGENAQARKKFITIPQYRYEAALKAATDSAPGNSLSAAGQSIRRQLNKMEQYVLPPQFDFLNNELIDPLVMYMFEFKYELDRDDLSYIWQNLAPRKSGRMSLAEDAVAHELINTELLTEQNLLENPNLRWMVFKVKQRSQAMYEDVVVEQVSQAVRAPELQGALIEGTQNYKTNFNWPYDFVSIIETVKIDADVLYKNREPAEVDTSAFIKTPDSNPGASAGKVNSSLDKAKRRSKPFELEVKKASTTRPSSRTAGLPPGGGDGGSE
jgi:hypothetical protein